MLLINHDALKLSHSWIFSVNVAEYHIFHITNGCFSYHLTLFFKAKLPLFKVGYVAELGIFSTSNQQEAWLQSILN